MSLPSGLEKLRIDPATIIADRDSQSLGGELHLDLDPLGARMLERIDHRLTADPVDLVPDGGVERARLPLTDDAEIDSFLRVQLLADSREGLFEIVVLAAGRTQPSDCIASLFDHTPHQLEHPAQALLVWPFRRHMVYRNVELHRRAQKTLQQRVVQFLRDARSLRQPLLELKLQPRPHLPHAPPEARPDEAGGGRSAEKKESSRLIKGGQDGEL